MRHPNRDLDGGVARVVVWAARAGGQRGGQVLLPGAGGELAHPVLLARDPGAAAQGAVDAARGVADGGVHVLPVVLAGKGEMTAVGAEDLGERADVEPLVVAAGGPAGPEPVVAAEGLVGRQLARDGSGDAVA